MPFGGVDLVPGVNVERTPTLLRAGISASSLIRFRDGLVQKYGGWAKFFPFSVAGIPRALHAWQDLNSVGHLAVGTTTQLGVITSGVLTDITPQTLTSNFAPNISTTNGSPFVDIIDPNVSNVTVFDSVFFNTPVSQGGLILDGFYQITSVTGTHSYRINAGKNATSTNTNPVATNAITAAGNNTLHFAATPGWVAQGMSIADLTTPAAIPASTTVTSTTGITVVMSNNAAAPGVGNGDSIVFCSIPVFTTATGSSSVNVQFNGHGVSVGNTVAFAIATTGNGVTIGPGSYTVASVVDANNFTITVTTQATATSSFTMNGGSAQLVYYINLGPNPGGAGYGLGPYGGGGYGTGIVPAAQTGSPLASTDWTLDNWGQLLTACPRGGAIYYWDPTGGFQNATQITTAPPFNFGHFVSQAQQIMVAWGSSTHAQIGWVKNPMLVQWSDVSNFFQWTATSTTQAGNYVIPNGSEIRGGMAVMANLNLIWTDQDVWAMNYIGPPTTFGFVKIGAGAGMVSAHAAQALRGSIFWMGRTNFYGYSGGSVSVLQCPIWDVVFQNLNTNFLQNVRAMPNTPFNEVGWLYPSTASVNGECDSYVKVNMTEPGQPWDYGPLPRSAWIDQNILGMPIAATPTAIIYQHETTSDADNQPLAWSFQTGYFYIAEGEEFAFVDQVYPDFKWGFFGAAQTAQVQMTFLLVDYPDETPRMDGPYTVTQATKILSVRMRARQMAFLFSGQDLGSFMRIGHVRYRYRPMGRR